jgi:formylglycine-generating enzyme required for sulfatase activity
MKRHVLDGPQLPEEWPGGVPLEFEEVLRHALAMRVDERFGRTGEFFEELEELEKVKPNLSKAVSDAFFESPARVEKSKESQEEKSVQPIKSVAPPPPEFDDTKHSQAQQRQADTGKVSDFVEQQAGDFNGEFEREAATSVKSRLPMRAADKQATTDSNLKMMGCLGGIGVIVLIGMVVIIGFLIAAIENQNNTITFPLDINEIATETLSKVTYATLPSASSTASPTVTQTNNPTATWTSKPIATLTITPEPTNTTGPAIFNGSAPPSSASLGDLWRSPVDGMLLAYIPAGEFQMGNEYGDEDEKPVHTVYLDVYWMDTTEVTNEMFAQFLNEMGNQVEYAQDWYVEKYIKKVDNDWQVLAGYEDHPVLNANWFGARAYCEWAGRKLPSEAEWEKAARGGDEGNTYPWGNQEPSCQLGAINGANYEGCGLEDTTQVASFSSNSYGLFDMAGNVYEYVMDKYSKFYYTVSPQENPKGPDSGSIAIIRGGAFSSQASNLNVATRDDVYSGYIPMPVGFRCVFSP